MIFFPKFISKKITFYAKEIQISEKIQIPGKSSPEKKPKKILIFMERFLF